MKALLTILLLVGCSFFLQGQDKEWPKVDVSTMDCQYYPSSAAWRNYLSGEDRTQSPKIKLLYSRPMKKDRDIWGALVPYGSEWRLGANEATMITFYRTVGIGDAVLPAGQYTMSALVNQDNWTVNFSTEKGLWGAENRDPDQTAAAITVPVKQLDYDREDLVMAFQEVDDRHANLVIEWAGRQAMVPIAFNPVIYNNVDPSPMDMAHYPRKSAFTNYLEGDEKNITPKIQVQYSRPHKKGRDIFGSLLPYGKEWRLGANEATEITIYEKANIGGAELVRGTYAIAVTPHTDRWEITFHKDFPIWGVHERDTEKEVATITVPTSTDSEALEALSVMFSEATDGTVNMIFGWDTTRCAVPITFVR